MSLYKDASLVMIPSAYKDGKLYSIRPTDGSGDFTFSRGSNLAATRVDVNGLIEKGRENLLLQSNQFDTTPWINAGTTDSSGQLGYDGSNDAWLITKVSANGRMEQSVSSSGVNTLSVYAKANASDWALIQHIGGGNPYAFFNISTGEKGALGGGAIDSKIQSIGNGWYKLSITSNETISQVRIYPSEANTTSGTSGSIYIQDAQLEAGLVATDYIETGASTAQAGILEDMPRLDYSGSCPSLLLEPQRSNLVAHSEYYGSSEWSKRTSDSTAVPVVTNNYAVSPEGVKNASRVVVTKPSTDNDFAVITDFGGVTKSAGDKFASSVYLKATDASQVGKIVDIYSYESGGGYWTIKSHTLTDDWVRVDAVSTANTSTGNVELLNIGKARASAGGTTLANMATDFLVYGAQFEEGSYPTSYIPTYGSSVTRSDESSFVSSLQSNNIVEATDSYTIFFDISNDKGGNSADDGNSQWLKGLDSSGTLIWTLRKNDVTNQRQHRLYINVDSGYVFNYTNISKACFVFTGNKIRAIIDGALDSTYTSDNSPLDLNKIELNYGSADRTSIELSQLALFPTALTDSECIALTTL
jgi:hypothetical protein